MNLYSGNKVTRKEKKSGPFKEENLECYNPPLDGTPIRKRSGQLPGEADPGVISEGESEDDEFTVCIESIFFMNWYSNVMHIFQFDDLSHKSSASSLSASQPAAPSTPTVTTTSTTLPAANSLENLAGGEFLRRTSAVPPTKPPAKPPRTVAAPEKTVDEWEEKLYGKQGKGDYKKQ
jgi:hypothetical protein